MKDVEKYAALRRGIAATAIVAASLRRDGLDAGAAQAACLLGVDGLDGNVMTTVGFGFGAIAVPFFPSVRYPAEAGLRDIGT